jgi:prepilin-type N-terminal cleavage/methylation domain-containing protein
MKVQLKKVKAAGFSLVELLVVIAVIGIMAAIAIPMISNINENATIAKDKRNAQNIASVFGAARAAGAAVDTADVTAAVGDLKTGVPGTGTFLNTTFKVNIGTDEQGPAEDYLVMTTDGTLEYTGVDANP